MKQWHRYCSGTACALLAAFEHFSYEYDPGAQYISLALGVVAVLLLLNALKEEL